MQTGRTELLRDADQSGKVSRDGERTPVAELRAYLQVLLLALTESEESDGE